VIDALGPNINALPDATIGGMEHTSHSYDTVHTEYLMRRSAAVLIIILLGAAGAAYWYFSPRSSTFDTGGRYDPSRLDDMGVIYVNQSDIYAFNEGYSESENCPWGFVHNGIDYFFRNGSAVLAAAPGQVISVTTKDYGPQEENRYHVAVEIQFNATVILLYNFEPWTQDAQDLDCQVELLMVDVGDWVVAGQQIATFLNMGDGAHVHFGVIQNGAAQCPRQYFSDAAYAEIMELVHYYHPDWDLCYP